jgi:hypothetical protein
MLTDVKLDFLNVSVKQSSLFCRNMGDDEKGFCDLDAYTPMSSSYSFAH